MWNFHFICRCIFPFFVSWLRNVCNFFFYIILYQSVLFFLFSEYALWSSSWKYRWIVYIWVCLTLFSHEWHKKIFNSIHINLVLDIFLILNFHVIYTPSYEKENSSYIMYSYPYTSSSNPFQHLAETWFFFLSHTMENLELIKYILMKQLSKFFNMFHILIRTIK